MFYNENLCYMLCSCTNPLLGKILYLRYWSKCTQPIKFQDFKSTISPEKIDETAAFSVCWYKFTKIKIWWKFFLGGHGQKWELPVWSWNLKLTVSQKLIDGVKWFFACWYYDFWVDLIKNGHGLLVYETLTSAAF